jgi:hypothetical protein
MPLPPPSHITFAHYLLQITMHAPLAKIIITVTPPSLSMWQLKLHFAHASVDAYKADVIR